jgi:rSAM/selenodomain-associated transferase 1
VHGSVKSGAKEGASLARAQVAACGIAVMAKASAIGSAKTRLVPPLTYREAAALNTAFLKDIADNLAAAGQRASIAAYMAFGPPGSERFFRDHLPSDIGLIEVWLPGFGDCLYHAVQEVLARGHDSAVVLNSDSPTLPTALLVETAKVLAQPGDRAVLGPARDGGYYLLGLKRAHRRMFDDIAWSTSRVAEETMARAREIGVDMHVLAPWYDVDDLDALRSLRAELAGTACAASNHPNIADEPGLRDEGGFETCPHRGALSPHPAAHTAQLMSSLLRTTDLARRLGDLQALEGVAL